MKKLCCIFIILFLLSGCSNQDTKNTSRETINQDIKVKEQEEKLNKSILNFTKNNNIDNYITENDVTDTGYSIDLSNALKNKDFIFYGEIKDVFEKESKIYIVFEKELIAKYILECDAEVVEKIKKQVPQISKYASNPYFIVQSHINSINKLSYEFNPSGNSEDGYELNLDTSMIDIYRGKCINISQFNMDEDTIVKPSVENKSEINTQELMTEKSEPVEPSQVIVTPQITTKQESNNSDNKEIVVYITKTGAKYHRAGCRYLSRSQIPINLTDARKSYTPCSVCNPPQ